MQHRETFLDSHGSTVTVPKSLEYLRERSVIAVLPEVLETIQRTKDKYVTMAPRITPEHVGLELYVAFKTIYKIFFHLEKVGLIKRTTVLKNESFPESPIKDYAVYKVLRDAKEEDLDYGKETSTQEGQKDQGQNA